MSICTCRGDCFECVPDAPDAPRSSVMPPCAAPVDPLFAQAVDEFAPDEWVLAEKGGRGL
jgi:hypothetical protein